LRFSLRFLRCVALVALPLLLQGCATVRSWVRSAGTYAVAAETPTPLNGRGEVHGNLFLTSTLSRVMMQGLGPPKVAAFPTTVIVEPLGLSVETDPDGRFTLPHLDPGEYSIAFQDPGGREIWTEFVLEPDQRLDVAVWVQWGGPGAGQMSEGTPALGMFPGAHGWGAVQSGDSGTRGGKRGGGGSGGGMYPRAAGPDP